MHLTMEEDDIELYLCSTDKNSFNTNILFSLANGYVYRSSASPVTTVTAL